MQFKYVDEYQQKVVTVEVPAGSELIPGDPDTIKIPGNKVFPRMPLTFLSNPRFAPLGVKVLSESPLAMD